MKEYRSMEAYKVSFNAKEQVAAACAVWEQGGKYTSESLNGGTMCEVVGGKYGTTQMPAPLDFMNGACFVSEGGDLADGSAKGQYSA